jgi:hypothetical protein
LRGATLSEILISLMVMSIGVVSLATLFPISVLRSIQASQLTNATIHRLNVEQLIGLFPRMVHDPDGDGNIAEHELQYSAVPPGTDNPDNAGPTGDFRDEGRFVVDPLGFTSSLLTPAVQSVFGNDNGAVPANPILRYHGGYSTQALAKQYAYLPDSWQLVAKGVVASVTVNTLAPPAIPPPTTETILAFPSNIDLTDFRSAVGAGVSARIVLFSSINPRQSLIRLISAAADIDPVARTVKWYDQDLPYAVSNFRLELSEPRYSWLLTVRKTPDPTTPGQGTANVDVVVFHKRAFSAAAEQRFSVSNWTGTDCTLDLTVAPAGTKPFLKKGGFLFDDRNARWYRIVQLKNEATTAPTITLDRSVIAPVNTTTGAIETPKWAIAIPGIVEVYPIGAVNYNPNNPP